MLGRTVCYGTTGDEKCICFSLKLIMARVRMVLLSPKKHLRCLCELNACLGKGGSRQTAQLLPGAKGTLGRRTGALGIHSKAGILLSASRKQAVCLPDGGRGMWGDSVAAGRALFLPPDRLAASEASAVVIEPASSCCTSLSHREN